MKFADLTSRVLVAFIMGPLILGLTFMGGYYFVAFGVLIANLAIYEFAGMVKAKGSFLQVIMAHLGVTALIINAKAHFAEQSDLLLVVVLAIAFYELFRNKARPIFNSSVTLFGVLYVGLALTSAIGIREHFMMAERGGFFFIAILLSIWISDSAAYFSGIAFGKHKLFPRVSPKKSWEGAIGGFFGAILSFYLAKTFGLSFLSIPDVVALGAIVGIIGPLGDLFESLLKRDANIKDSSHIIPGHGGIFDRFDSLIAVSPVIYLYVKFLIKA